MIEEKKELDGIDEEEFEIKPPEPPKKSKKAIGIALLILLLLLGMIFLYWLMTPSKVKVPVKAPVAQASPNQQTSEQARDAVLEDLKALSAPVPGASVSASPSATPVVASGAGTIDPNLAVTAPPVGKPTPSPAQQSVMAPPAHVMDGKQNGQVGSQQGYQSASQREIVPYKVSFTPQKSWTIPVEKPAAVVEKVDKGLPADRPAPMVNAKPVVRPTFGTQVPVQVVGVFFTLRQDAMVRLQVTRDIQGDDWYIKKGTIFIGQLNGQVADRAFVSIKGYIDLESKGLVPTNGDLLGSDGGPGIKGKKRSIGRSWWNVLDRVTERGVQALSGIMGRNQVIVAANPGQIYRDAGYGQSGSNQVREYLEIAASSPAYILITDLPNGVNLSGSKLAEAFAGKVEPMTEAELADVLSSEDPAKIQAAIPRMPPEMQNLARQVLQSIGR